MWIIEMTNLRFILCSCKCYSRDFSPFPPKPFLFHVHDIRI